MPIRFCRSHEVNAPSCGRHRFVAAPTRMSASPRSRSAAARTLRNETGGTMQGWREASASQASRVHCCTSPDASWLRGDRTLFAGYQESEAMLRASVHFLPLHTSRPRFESRRQRRAAASAPGHMPPASAEATMEASGSKAPLRPSSGPCSGPQCCGTGFQSPHRILAEERARGSGCSPAAAETP